MQDVPAEHDAAQPTFVRDTEIASLRTWPASCFTMRWINCGGRESTGLVGRTIV